MGRKAAVQVLKEADDLKIKISQKTDLLNNSEAWTNQQKLQSIYHQVLVLDLEYALDKKVEQDLWNIGFKSHINCLQELARDKKNPQRSEFQSLLAWALDAASGFYITLLHELCNMFDIDLPFRKRGTFYGLITNNTTDQINMPQTSSCLYICQYCLVHLGDIARYRNQRKQAESFYKQAIIVSPTSGHPYNQLALLEASKGDKFSTVFYYIRSIAVKNPFPAATTNLLNTLNSCIDKESTLDKIQTKMTVNEFIQLFLCTHGYFQTNTELESAQVAVRSLNSVMTALVATQSFTKDHLLKMTVINLYTLKNLGKPEELTPSEKRIREMVLELIAGSLSALLMPIHTLNLDESLLSYYALPSIKFLLCFIQTEPHILKENVFKDRLQIWPSLCKLVNNVGKFMKGFSYNKYSKYPLLEDKNLQGFIPLAKCFKDLDFDNRFEDVHRENLVRMRRLIDFCQWLSDYDINGNKFIVKKIEKGTTVFNPGFTQPDPTNELLEEMRSFNIIEASDSKKSEEKKAGILKPQGSLEKSREEREVKLGTNEEQSNTNVNTDAAAKSKRSKQNVALQSIYKKMEESKQVKFSVDESEKEKSVKFETTKPVQQTQQKIQSNQQPFSIPIRTQSFNQNHPAFPVTPASQADYLTNLRNVSSLPDVKNDQMVSPQYQNSIQSLQPNQFSNQMQFPSIPSSTNFSQNQYGNWPRNEAPITPQNTFHVPFKNQDNWWQNIPPPPPLQNTQSYPQRQESMNNFPNHLNYQPYPNNRPNFMQSNLNMQPNSVNPQSPPQNNPYDLFNSPWSNMSRPFSTDATFDNTHNMSMRQAMLKEAGGPSTSQEAMGKMPVSKPPEKYMTKQQNQPPTYSLFNTNSWAPNLVPVRNNKISEPSSSMNSMNLPQHSLFGGHGPTSLAQLLEHQQNQMNKTD